MRETLESVLRRRLDANDLAWIDEIVTFRSLERGDLQFILDRQLARVQERLATRGVRLVLTPAAKDYLLDEGCSLRWAPIC